jgi:hypothetical protein
LICLLSALPVTSARATIFQVDQLRQLFTASIVAPDSLPPREDLDDPSDLTPGSFVQAASALVDYGAIGGARGTASQDSRLQIAPDESRASGAGFADAGLNIDDPGFDSVARAVGGSHFEWTFRIDEASKYTLAVGLRAELTAFALFSAGPLDLIPGSSYVLEDLSRHVPIHENVIVDFSSDGEAESASFNHMGTLSSGTYRLKVDALTEGLGWENALASANASFVFSFEVETVPEPKAPLLQAAALFALILVRRRRRWPDSTDGTEM